MYYIVLNKGEDFILLPIEPSMVPQKYETVSKIYNLEKEPYFIQAKVEYELEEKLFESFLQTLDKNDLRKES